MAVTELPFGSIDGNTFTSGNHALRSAWVNSFYLPADQYCSYVLQGSPGAVTGTGGTVTLGIPQGGQVAILAGGQYASGVTGIQQVYIAASGSPNCVAVSSLSASFPVGSLPLAFLVLDNVGRVQQVVDMRPSYLSSAPNLGTGMTESVADATRRVYFQNNFAVPRTYSLSAQIPPDLPLPSPGFLLGAGAVVLSGNTISTRTTYISAKTMPAQLVAGQISQGYIDPSTGALATRIPTTSGVFPNGSLPLFEATTDSTGLIRSLIDYRPSYI